MAPAIRRMRADDARGAAELWAKTWSALETSLGEPPRRFDEELLGRLASRFGFLLGTDPGGSFVAEDEDGPVGIAVSHLRGDRFVLANLAVAPSAQGQGVGKALLSHALAYGAGAPLGLICSSRDPRALQRYLRAGFRLSPAMEAIGRPTDRVGMPATVRRSDGGGADLDVVDRLDLSTRHSSRRDDISFLLESGAGLWIDDDGAYAVARDGDLAILCAEDDRLGCRLLAALLSGQVTGRPLTARWLTASAPWAFAAASEAGATLKGHGAVMARGEQGDGGACLPSGVFG